MEFPEKLQTLRKKKGLSQQALADMANVSQTAVYHWEKGLRKPRLEQAIRLAAALDVSINDLDPELSQFSREGLHEIVDSILSTPPTEKRINLLIDNFGVKLTECQPVDKIVAAFKQLNTTGQDKAIEQVELLTKMPEFTKDEEQALDNYIEFIKDKHPDYWKKFRATLVELENNKPELNAAQARTDKVSTPEDQAHDDAIMDDDKEWE